MLRWPKITSHKQLLFNIILYFPLAIDLYSSNIVPSQANSDSTCTYFLYHDGMLTKVRHPSSPFWAHAKTWNKHSGWESRILWLSWVVYQMDPWTKLQFFILWLFISVVNLMKSSIILEIRFLSMPERNDCFSFLKNNFIRCFLHLHFQCYPKSPP